MQGKPRTQIRKFVFLFGISFYSDTCSISTMMTWSVFLGWDILYPHTYFHTIPYNSAISVEDPHRFPKSSSLLVPHFLLPFSRFLPFHNLTAPSRKEMVTKHDLSEKQEIHRTHSEPIRADTISEEMKATYSTNINQTRG
jgi:hypothetical protein